MSVRNLSALYLVGDERRHVETVRTLRVTAEHAARVCAVRWLAGPQVPAIRGRITRRHRA